MKHNQGSIRKGEKGKERIFEAMMAKNIPILMTAINLHSKET